MHSFYVLRHTGLPNNSDTITECYVLADRDDLIRVLTGLDVDPRWTEACTLTVHAGGAVTGTVDLLATVLDEDPGEDEDEDDEGYRTLDLAGLEIPPLPGLLLPPGHPVIVEGEALQYGCTAFYN